MTPPRESFLHRSFWLGQVDARPISLLRIAVGMVVLIDLGERLADFHSFYTDAGIIVPVGPLPRALGSWSIFWLAGAPGPALAVFVVGFACALAFTVGYRARLANVLLWVFMVSLHHRNPYVSDGGDTVIISLLFWSMFGDPGARVSLDVRLGRRQRRDLVPAAPLRILQLQVALIYLVTFFAKSGPTWWHGTAVGLALSNTDWTRGLGPALASHPGLSAAMTYGTLAIEAAFPLLVLSPWRTTATRAVAIALGAALHAGIFATLRVGVFSLVMPASYLVYVAPTWLDRLQAWAWRRGPRAVPAVIATPARSPPGPPAGARRAEKVWLAVLACQFGLVACEQVVRATSARLPEPIAWELRLVAQRQNWRMFSPDVPTLDVFWHAPGVLADGQTVELTRVVAPQLNQRGGFVYSRWRRLRSSLASADPEIVHALGRYLCRRWNGEVPGPRLLRFELAADAIPLAPGVSPHHAVALRQECVAR